MAVDKILQRYTNEERSFTQLALTTQLSGSKNMERVEKTPETQAWMLCASSLGVAN